MSNLNIKALILLVVITGPIHGFAASTCPSPKNEPSIYVDTNSEAETIERARPVIRPGSLNNCTPDERREILNFYKSRSPAVASTLELRIRVLEMEAQPHSETQQGGQ
jgi:hypothetical protein